MRTVNELKEKMLLQQEKHAGYKHKICICGGTSCSSQNSRDVYDELIKELKRTGLDSDIEVMHTGCHGLCGKGPIMTVYPDDITYAGLVPDNMEELVEGHFINGEIVNKFLYLNMETADGKSKFIPLQYSKFSKMQNQVVFENCGKIDPEDIEDYIGVHGYEGYAKAITEMKPSQIIETVTESGLRGRGGAGYLAGVKWKLAAEEESNEKYVICNADEGDLGAYMDRSILEANPHAVIEAMAIAGYAIGADKGYIYIRPEYTAAVANLGKALVQARDNGLIGTNILGTGFNFDIQLRLGAGAYICGEETAMLHSFEMNRGEPGLKLKYPVKEGLYERPTVINNVETFAFISHIILHGADWFQKMGNETGKGTKIFALGGSLNNTGLVEVPLGIALRTLVEDIGGGISGGKRFKAVQTGGASGGYIPASYLDIEMDYDRLKEIGTLMGAGGLLVLDESTCIVENAMHQVEFSMKESCGKCTACRIGTKRMYELLEKMTKGEADMEDLNKLEELADYVKGSSLCGLGKSASNPVLSSLRHFKNEYLAHVIDKKCFAATCKPLVTYVVDQEKCEGCGVCAASCPARCITERQDETKVIHSEACTACDTCYKLCPVKAITKE